MNSIRCPSHPRSPVAAAVLLLALAMLGGCSAIGGLFDGDKAEYRTGGTTRTAGLEVPPDLTQLAGDSRYAPQRGVISASAVNAPPRTTPGGGQNPDVSAVPTVACTVTP